MKPPERRVQFHLDENIPPAVASGLRSRQIGVTTTAEAGLGGATDAQQLEYASSSARVLVTRDADFLRLHAAGASHSGIAFCAQHLTTGQIVRGLVLIHDLLRPEELVSRVEHL